MPSTVSKAIAGLLALPLLFLPSQAKAIVIGGYEIDSGAKVWCNVRQFNLTTPTAGGLVRYLADASINASRLATRGPRLNAASA